MASQQQSSTVAGGGCIQSQHFLLKWNNHRSNMVNVFESLLQSENLVDVTIAVEGKFLKAHKIVLSACSPYFQSMFVNHTPSEKYPVLVFHDMKYQHLKTLLDFMYRGEISIDEKDLGEVLKVAEALSIRGLSSFENDEEEQEQQKDEQSSQSQTKKDNSMTNSSCTATNSNLPTSSSGSGERDHHHQNQSQINGNTSSSQPKSTPPTPVKRPKKQKQQHKVERVEKGTAIMNASMKGINANGSGNNKWANKDRSQSPANNRISSLSHTSTPTTQNPKSEQNNPIATGLSSSPSSTVPTVKKRRGRQPKNKLVDNQHQTPLGFDPSTNKLHEKFNSAVSGVSGQPLGKSVTTVARQGVRRRLPRRFPGVPSRLKRIKLGKRDPSDTSPQGDEGDLGGPFGTALPPEEAALLQEMLDSADCEPLSEMSVRGLDLFKYASIEDGVYRCIECEKLRIPKTFKNKYSFQRHAFLYHEGNMRKVFPCPVCSREFSRPDKMKNHMRSVHEASSTPKSDGGTQTPSSNSNQAPGEEDEGEEHEPKIEMDVDADHDDDEENSCDS